MSSARWDSKSTVAAVVAEDMRHATCDMRIRRGCRRMENGEWIHSTCWQLAELHRSAVTCRHPQPTVDPTTPTILHYLLGPTTTHTRTSRTSRTSRPSRTFHHSNQTSLLPPQPSPPFSPQCGVMARPPGVRRGQSASCSRPPPARTQQVLVGRPPLAFPTASLVQRETSWLGKVGDSWSVGPLRLCHGRPTLPTLRIRLALFGSSGQTTPVPCRHVSHSPSLPLERSPLDLLVPTYTHRVRASRYVRGLGKQKPFFFAGCLLLVVPQAWVRRAAWPPTHPSSLRPPLCCVIGK